MAKSRCELDQDYHQPSLSIFVLAGLIAHLELFGRIPQSSWNPSRACALVTRLRIARLIFPVAGFSELVMVVLSVSRLLSLSFFAGAAGREGTFGKIVGVLRECRGRCASRFRY